ncbi:MAG: NADH-quinone oxidoreductase subunit D [Thermincola sp.]|jgi:NADH-quinone oxidoreductase subunit D|nr:NADH-quinone oxidoreductase subunit D [Thermincola sp.]MDT3701486.1 NADH-quinone oxidoreductase subunit D [Thermincola sp.]
MLKTQELNLNLGPVHPSTHGVYRCVLTLEGEYIKKAVNHIGYLHRGLEKLAEARTYNQFIPYTDRLDYCSGLANEVTYVMAVEKLMGISEEIPERAQYLRVICNELQRLGSHGICVGSFALDIAGATGFFYAFRERDRVLELITRIGGNRLTPNYMRIGGVAWDLEEDFFKELKQLMDEMPAYLDEYDGLLTGNEILQARTIGVAPVTKEQALDWGFTGPNLRACGVDSDMRRDEPYGIYDRFKFDVPVGENGDTFDRFAMRIREMRESVKIIQQAMQDIPEGPVMAKVPKVIKPPVGEVFFRAENSKGHLGFHIVSDGSTKPYRTRIYSPAFTMLGAFPEMAKGTHIMDAVLILASIDIVLGEVDR